MDCVQNLIVHRFLFTAQVPHIPTSGENPRWSANKFNVRRDTPKLITYLLIDLLNPFHVPICILLCNPRHVFPSVAAPNPIHKRLELISICQPPLFSFPLDAMLRREWDVYFLSARRASRLYHSQTVPKSWKDKVGQHGTPAFAFHLGEYLRCLAEWGFEIAVERANDIVGKRERSGGLSIYARIRCGDSTRLQHRRWINDSVLGRRCKVAHAVQRIAPHIHKGTTAEAVVVADVSRGYYVGQDKRRGDAFHSSQLATKNDGFKALDSGMEAASDEPKLSEYVVDVPIMKSFQNDEVLGLSQLIHSVRLLCCVRSRLLQKNVLASKQRLQSPFVMQTIGQLTLA